MTNSEQLKALLKNAIEEGFSLEDIEDIATDVKAEMDEEKDKREYLDDLQYEAAASLADFLCEMDYFGKDVDFDDVVESIVKSLQMIRDGKIKFSVKTSDFNFGTDYLKAYSDVCKFLKNM